MTDDYAEELLKRIAEGATDHDTPPANEDFFTALEEAYKHNSNPWGL